MTAPELDARFATLPANIILGYLDKLDRLFETEATWCKKFGAIDSAGKKLVDSTDPRAQAWCMVGGSWLVTNDQPNKLAHRQAHLEVMMTFRRVLDAHGLDDQFISGYNDAITFEELKAWIQQARGLAPDGRVLYLDVPAEQIEDDEAAE